MRLPTSLPRRPSAALIVACVALFISLGGASYAAFSVPNNSVGTAQLRNNAVSNSKLQNNSVSYKKIEAGSVGRVRANLGQLQARVSDKCAAGTAMGTISNTGKVTCNTTLPAGLETTSNTAALSATATTPITSLSLPAGPNYLTLANPTASVTGTGAAQRVRVSCTLTVGSNTQTRSVTVNTGTSAIATYASIPLQLAGPSGTATVACTAAAETGTLPATSVTSALDALQIAG